MDIVYAVLTVLFFIAAWGFTLLCDRLATSVGLSNAAKR